jgi:hypothetical protein
MAGRRALTVKEKSYKEGETGGDPCCTVLMPLEPASQLARQLALNNNVDLLVTSSTPETVNPVAVVAKP